MVPDAVKEMLEAKEREHTSQAYLKVLRVYLKQLSVSFHCDLRSVTTGQLSDFLRNMEVSARSKNNARATIGAFIKFCKERGWLARDHDGIDLVPKFKEKAGDIEIFKAAGDGALPHLLKAGAGAVPGHRRVRRAAERGD